MTNKRAIGDDFEEEIAQKLGLNFTPNSGAMFGDGDLRFKDYIFELKNRMSKEGYSIPSADIKKLKAQATKRFLDWIYIQRTQSGTAVTMDLDTFITIWSKLNE